MATYKHLKFLQTTVDVAFDKIHDPGVEASKPGIYRCEGCGKEIAIASGHKLPPQNHHQHTSAQGKVRWQLIVSHI